MRLSVDSFRSDVAGPWRRWAGAVFQQGDFSRRCLGETLESLGVGPATSASRIVFSAPGVKLRAYGPIAGRGLPSRPVLLIVPAPIKRHYIWDLAPEYSAVRACLEGGIRVYLIEWDRPDAALRAWGLGEYADRLIARCLDAVSTETALRQVFVAGHSLGGTLAALFASLHPQRVRGLLLIEAPLRFGAGTGDLDRFVAAGAGACCASVPENLAGNVPGSVLSTAAWLASPTSFALAAGRDWLLSLSCGKPDTIIRHLRVQRWMLDELPMSGHLFQEIVRRLYREDRFARGTLTIDGRQAAAGQVTMPTLEVASRHSRVTPPESLLARGTNAFRQQLWVEQEVGVALQHVTALVGSRAHQQLWPQIARWIHAQDSRQRTQNK